MTKQLPYHLISAAAGLALAATSGCGDNTVQCGEGTELVGGLCVGAAGCGPGTEEAPDGTCRAVCVDGTMFDPGSSQCLPDITGCAPNMVVVNGVCRDAADVTADYMEPAEPNGFEPGADPLAIDLPEVGGSVTIGGCTEPQPGPDPTGPDMPDFDVYLITAGGPMVLDITVDGYNGMAGGFALVSLEDALAENEWQRLGLNLVDDVAHREVLLPMAGTYALAITDSRTFMTGPSGNGSTCYLATVGTVSLPAPTPIVDTEMGVLNGQVQAFVYDPPADGDLIFNTGSTATAGALIDTVVLINDQYHQSAPGLDSRAPGDDADTNAANLADSDVVVFYVEAVVDFDIAEDDYMLEVYSGRPQALPTDGSTITIDNDGNFYRWVYFDANAGDVVHLNMSSDSASGIIAIVADTDLFIVSQICGGPCASYNGFLRFDETDRYYIALYDTSDPQPPSFELTSTTYVHTPTALTPGAPKVGLELNTDGNRFYMLDVTQLSWLQYVGEPTQNFLGQLDIELYSNDADNQRGELGGDIPRLLIINGLDATTDRGTIFDTGDMVLIRSRDDAFTMGATPGTYDFGLVDRVYTDLGVIDAATPYMASGLPLLAGEVNRYLLRVPQFSTADITVTGDAATDMAIDVYDAFENGPTIDAPGDGVAENTSQFRHVQPTWIAFGAHEWMSSAGIYDLSINVREPPVTITEGAIEFQSVCPFDGGPGEEVVWDGPPDDASALDPTTLQFAFELGGEAVTDAWMATNGYVTFATPTANPYTNPRIPSAAQPNFYIAPLFDDLNLVTGCVYSAADHIVFQWEGESWDTETPVQMQVILHGDNSFDFVYGEGQQLRTNSATLGYENSTGSGGFQMVFNSPSPIVGPGNSWTITP